jgi:hypothetical protein
VLTDATGGLQEQMRIKLTRRDAVLAGLTWAATVPLRGVAGVNEMSGSHSVVADAPSPSEAQYKVLDATIRSWW